MHFRTFRSKGTSACTWELRRKLPSGWDNSIFPDTWRLDRHTSRTNLLRCIWFRILDSFCTLSSPCEKRRSLVWRCADPHRFRCICDGRDDILPKRLYRTTKLANLQFNRITERFKFKLPETLRSECKPRTTSTAISLCTNDVPTTYVLPPLFPIFLDGNLRTLKKIKMK